MKKTMLYTSALLAALLTAAPVFALNQGGPSVENMVCKGPSRIFFDKKTFEQTRAGHANAYIPCRAIYKTEMTRSDGYADDWAPYSHFYSKLITTPRNTVLDTLHDYIPANASLKKINAQNPNDVVAAYRVIEKQDRRDLLYFKVYRALKQPDGSVRIYEFEITMQADTKSYDGTQYHPSVPQHAYDHFDRVVQAHTDTWVQAMQLLEIND